MGRSNLNTKLAKQAEPGWRAQLGEVMESKYVSFAVIVLIFVDLGATLVNVILEDTDLLNPRYAETGEELAEMTHNTCVSVLCIFLVEQLLHLIAFGKAFFSHTWYVLDLIAVSVSLLSETMLEGMAEDAVALFIVLRLWKGLAFLFDIALASKEYSEAEERTTPPICMKLTQQSEPGWRRQLGAVLESQYTICLVIILIMVDLVATMVNVTLEDTDWLNPRYEESGQEVADFARHISLCVLCIFLLEQVLHVVAFGKAFFSHTWYVLDLAVVSVSLLCEVVLSGLSEDILPMLVVLRLWKVVAFIFDIAYASKEHSELDEQTRLNTTPA